MAAILGTAGHIDHGKTALVRALTGQDTDRLKEEKERGISIDLGFAHFDLPDGTRAGIVDVPGHERFIRNMLAGAHGIDVVLLVVAADDGVMPQTEEHLEIVHLLGVERGIAVITKADLVPPTRLEDVKEEIAILLDGTQLAAAPCVAVSSLTGDGVEALRAEIVRQLALAPPRRHAGAFRLPVDRVFVMHGHGVVVTGTATSGRIRAGDTVRLLPGGEECRVRTLQVHGQAVDEALAGQRVALNLGGVEMPEIRRGHVLVDPRYQAATSRLDAVVEIRPSARRALKNHAAVRLHLATAAVAARVVLLDQRPELGRKERGYVQLVLDEEVSAVTGDRFVLRDETARRTLGGGVVLQPRAARHRRGDESSARLAPIEAAPDLPARIAALVLADGRPATPVEWLLEVLPDTAAEIRIALGAAPGLVLLPSADDPEAATPAAVLGALEAAVLSHLTERHRAAPLEPGVEMESVRTSIAPDLVPKLFRAVIADLERRGALARAESLLRLPSHAVALAAPERALGGRAERLLAEADLAPPDLRLMEEGLGTSRRRLTEILTHLEREGSVVRVGPDLYFAAAALERARALLVAHLEAHGEISAAGFRDLIQGSRKYSIALLDYFDRTGFTLRVGDLRKLRAGGSKRNG